MCTESCEPLGGYKQPLAWVLFALQSARACVIHQFVALLVASKHLFMEGFCIFTGLLHDCHMVTFIVKQGQHSHKIAVGGIDAVSIWVLHGFAMSQD